MKEKDTVGASIVLSGNEAIAQGAYEAGVAVASGYPGTPSSEILAELSRYGGIYTEWAPNEKVALEVVLGASFAGTRAMATMKHVGLNVAADPLFTAAYTGVLGGLVIVNADDPDMHSSQNEQDNRHYALAAKLPMLEPSDAAEAKLFLKQAFHYSELFDTPVILRVTTRVCHVRGIVKIESRETLSITPGIQRMPEKFVMLPGNARKRRRDMELRIQQLKKHAETCPENRIEWGDKKRGFITSGISYLYVKEAFPEASILKLGMVWPLPDDLIKKFAGSIDEVIVVEELDPYLETHVRALGVSCKGKELISPVGELSAASVRKAVLGPVGQQSIFDAVPLPQRPPTLCPGCPHRALFYVLSKLDVFVTGDIGCYTLGALPPLSAMDTCVCMGAGIGNAHGIEKALGVENTIGKVVAVIGDSTFFHSGITGLVNIVYNKGCSTVIVLDNRTTGMTGHQHHPSTGRTISGEKTKEIDIAALCSALGVEHVVTVNPNDLEKTEAVIRLEVNRREPSVVIAQAPCVLLPDMKALASGTRVISRTENCKGCKACLRLGCPAIEWLPWSDEQIPQGSKQKGISCINASLCYGCGQCAVLCKFGAITRTEAIDG
ncbi:MAG TPA: indolepyruvate ferredoxin oxidoreductase subunit alpha [Dissulfurispiraceae bacterium]|nr:indolepyruvate ferredoxin oxidoreductase subunit alpha [Dissulfurispiraceae bacterium]